MGRHSFSQRYDVNCGDEHSNVGYAARKADAIALASSHRATGCTETIRVVDLLASVMPQIVHFNRHGDA